MKKSVLPEVDVDELVHFLDLNFHLVQVLEDVDELFLAGIVPFALALLKLHHQLSQLSVLLEVLTQLVRVLSLSDLARHHFNLVSNVILLFLKGVKCAHHCFVVIANHLFHLGEVISDALILLTLVQEFQGAFSESLQVLVGVGEGCLEL